MRLNWRLLDAQGIRRETERGEKNANELQAKKNVVFSVVSFCNDDGGGGSRQWQRAQTQLTAEQTGDLTRKTRNSRHNKQ